MGVARLCAQYLGFLQKVARHLIDRGAECNATIRNLAATDVEIPSMLSKLTNNEEGTGNGPGTDYKRCCVFEFERSDSPSESGEESTASENGNDGEDWETENENKDQGSDYGDKDGLHNNDTADTMCRLRYGSSDARLARADNL